MTYEELRQEAGKYKDTMTDFERIKAYGRGQDAYDRLLEMIVTTGYKPTAEELAAAGMSESQAKAWLGYWQGQQVGSGGFVSHHSGDQAQHQRQSQQQ